MDEPLLLNQTAHGEQSAHSCRSASVLAGRGVDAMANELEWMPRVDCFEVFDVCLRACRAERGLRDNLPWSSLDVDVAGVRGQAVRGSGHAREAVRDRRGQAEGSARGRVETQPLATR